MSIGRMVRVILGIGLFFGPMAGTGIWNALEERDRAGQYRQARYVVTGFHCVPGGTPDPTDGETTASEQHCVLEGTIDGSPEELPTGRVADTRPGTEIAVWYAPALEPSGDDDPLGRVMWDRGEEPGAQASATLAAWVQLLVLFPIWVVALEFAYQFTAGPFWRRDSEVMIFAQEGVAPALGFGLAAVGLGILTWMVTVASTAGGWVFGALLSLIGLSCAIRRVDAINRQTRELHTRIGLWPIRFTRDQALSSDTSVLFRLEAPGCEASVSIDAPDGVETLLESHDVEEACGRARELSMFLPCDIEEEWPLAETGRPYDEATYRQDRADERELRLRRNVGRVGVLAAAALVASVFWLVPALHEPVLLPLLAPEMQDVPAPIRVLAVRGLGGNASDEAILALLRIANTAHPEWEAALGAHALHVLENTAGVSFEAADRVARIRLANRWAAGRLGREVDANGGVLAWYEVPPYYQERVDLVASDDPHEAWMAWSRFAAGDFGNSAKFVAAIGAVLADDRPISLAIKRGSFLRGPGPGQPPFEGQPEPIADHADDVLVRTVGGALALQVWGYHDVPGEELPEDFVGWWQEYARSRLLPPLREVPGLPGSGAGPGPSAH